MTLPSLQNRAMVNFNSFDAMAPTDFDEALQIPEEQVEEQVVPVIYDEPFPNFQPLSIEERNLEDESPIEETSECDEKTTDDLKIESVMPGIYLTKNFIAWNEENLRAHGFTHIIIIDKHIQELFYPSPVFKLAALNKNNELYSTAPFDYFCNTPTPPKAALNFSKEFEAIDLNFGEKPYLTTVLPNCYRAVRFINKALQSAGTVLVIDCNGGEQKCMTIILAYMMYRHNINFESAFKRLRTFHKRADLDHFYVSQLYEYEPILQVQRAQSRGQSCSRELHAAILKRKKSSDDELYSDEPSCSVSKDGAKFIIADASTKNTFLLNLNPLPHFNATMAEQPQPQQPQSPDQQQERTLQFQQPVWSPTEFATRNRFLIDKGEFRTAVTSDNQATAASDDYDME